MLTIGVLGGVGPQATMAFEARIHEIARLRVPRLFNSGYPPMVVYYLRFAPFLLDEQHRAILPLRPNPRLLQVARDLGALSDFLVITSNAPHLFIDAIAAAAGRPVLSMVDLVLEQVRQRGWRRVGVLGFGEPTVYTTRLQALGLPYEIAEPELRVDLDHAIGATMEGTADDRDRAAAARALQDLRRRGVDGVILGCTEIPLLLLADAAGPGLVDPLELLAQACVERACLLPPEVTAPST